MTRPEVRQDPNYLGALFSFLRVFATNIATAWLTLELVAQEELLDNPKAILVACLTALALTVVNFFRTGEVRFGSPPNVTDAGNAQLEFLGRVLIIVGAGLIVFDIVVDDVTGLTVPGIVAALLGIVCVVWPDRR